MLVKVFGVVELNYNFATLFITHTAPDGTSTTHKVYTTKDSYYEIYFTHNWDSPRGTYLISTVMQSVEIGSISYELIHDPSYKSAEEIMAEYKSGTSQESNISVSTKENLVVQSKIPSWVKNVFGWYYLDKISEDGVISAIKYLISKNVIKLD